MDEVFNLDACRTCIILVNDQFLFNTHSARNIERNHLSGSISLTSPIPKQAASVTRLDKFWKFLATWFLIKVAHIHGGLMG